MTSRERADAAISDWQTKDAHAHSVHYRSMRPYITAAIDAAVAEERERLAAKADELKAGWTTRVDLVHRGEWHSFADLIRGGRDADPQQAVQ